MENPKSNISGRRIWAGVWSESKPHLLNKLNYVPWDLVPSNLDDYGKTPGELGRKPKTTGIERKGCFRLEKMHE
jgi:hypothetical protein